MELYGGFEDLLQIMEIIKEINLSTLLLSKKGWVQKERVLELDFLGQKLRN